MRTIELIDYLQRIINSLLFRIVLILYSIVILLQNENFLEIYYYFFIIGLYLILYFYLIRIPNKNDKIRLINDFIFINIILYGKDPYNYINYTYLTLHLINNINFSGKSKSFYPYFLIATSLLFNIYIYKTNNNILLNKYDVYSLVPLIFILFISYYTTLRIKSKQLSEKLNFVVDDFYVSLEDFKKPHKIYKSLINVIHNHFNNKYVIEDIFCLIKPENTSKLCIVNGSRFIWNINFKNDNIYNDILKNKFIQNQEVEIEGVIKENNFIVYSNVQNTEYFYLFIINETIPFYFLIIQFFRTLEPTLNKISRILLSEKMLSEIRKAEIEKISDKILYVNKASKTMHFIRNKLGPFSNLLKNDRRLQKSPK